MIVFAVPDVLMSKAIGNSGKNVRTLQETLGKRIKIVREARGLEDAERFVHDIVEPVSFKSLEIRDNEFILMAGSQHKASLIGRNRIRFQELAQIVKDTFGKELRII